MNPPYTFRILAALPHGTPIELFRSLRRFSWDDWHQWTDEMDAAWECWVEVTLPESKCLSSRPIRPRSLSTTAASTHGLNITCTT